MDGNSGGGDDDDDDDVDDDNNNADGNDTKIYVNDINTLASRS